MYLFFKYVVSAEMMKRRIILFLVVSFFFCCGSIVYAQGISVPQKIQIDGVIINKENNEPVPFVHVINLTTNVGTASNLQGRFSIEMKHSDSLIFSAIGFDKFIFSLKQEVKVTRLDISIEMNTNSLELEPVQIFAYKDEKAFKQAILDAKVELKPDQTRMQLPGFYYGPRREVKPTLLSPVAYIYSKVSKQAKEERKYKRLEREYDTWFVDVYKKYNPQKVQEITNLDADEVDDFMRFCKLDENFIRLRSEYEVVVAINKCLEDYLDVNKEK